MLPSFYSSSTNGMINISDFLTFDGTASTNNGTINATVKKTTGHDVSLVFRYIKKKFNLLERVIIDRRLERLEKAFDNAVDNGQEALGNKLLLELAREVRESAIYAKGIRYYVDREILSRVKNKIRDGHISDTKLKDYTRVIPKDILEKRKKVEDVFDGFVIYHYYNSKIEKKLEEKQQMSPEEKNKMRDPILFGWIKECDRLYFIGDWEDEFCDLTFDEIIGVVGETKLTKIPIVV